MAEPFSVVCTHCKAKLKLKSSAAIGKKIACPKCQKAFVAKAPAAAAEEEVDLFGDLPLDDYEAPEEEKPDEEEAPVVSRRGSGKSGSGASKGKRKSKGSDSNVGGLLMMALFVLVGAGVVGGGGYMLFNLLPSGGGLAAYLPEETDVVIHVRVADLLAAPIVSPLLNEPKFQEGMGEMVKQTGLSLNDIESVTIGAVGAIAGMDKPSGPIGYRPPQVERFVAVVQTKAPINFDQIKTAFKTPTTPGNHNGQDYFTSQANGKVLGFCRAKEKTLLIAPETELKTAIDSKGAAPAKSRYRFVDLSQDVVVAFGPTDRSLFRTKLGMQFFEIDPTTQARKPTEADIVNGVSWGLIAGDNITVRQDVRYNGSSTAKNSVAAHETELTELKDNLGLMKGQIAVLAFAAPTMAEPANKVFDQISQGVNGGTVVATSSTVTTQVTFAGAIVTDFKNLANAAIAKMGEGGGAGFPFPGLPSAGVDPTAGLSPGLSLPTTEFPTDGTTNLTTPLPTGALVPMSPGTTPMIPAGTPPP